MSIVYDIRVQGCLLTSVVQSPNFQRNKIGAQLQGAITEKHHRLFLVIKIGEKRPNFFGFLSPNGQTPSSLSLNDFMYLWSILLLKEHYFNRCSMTLLHHLGKYWEPLLHLKYSCIFMYITTIKRWCSYQGAIAHVISQLSRDGVATRGP